MLILIHLYRNTSCSLICIPLCQCIWQNLPLVSHNCLIYSSSDFHRSNMQTGWHVGLFPSTNYPVAATLLHPWMPERRQMSIFSRCILINVRSAAYRCWSQTSIFQHCSQSRCKLSFWDFNKRFLPFDGIIRPVIIDGFGAATRCQIGLSLFGCGEIVAEKKTAQNKKGAAAKKKKKLIWSRQYQGIPIYHAQRVHRQSNRLLHIFFWYVIPPTTAGTTKYLLGEI